ncbi:heme-binding protein [Erythrobacter sp.]|uniref:SOUL family heme-binding protein n=1 Tax=Erythrobacter sp. TaxID=1042 RepID=UPI001B0516D2|nr:heme-binding protein [Erythrobacter sp.]MBO6527860.1 heme-binding protein [Erythrobacter sp.]MBO6528747.1 heme-binding protein [Erythrobacter sp.]
MKIWKGIAIGAAILAIGAGGAYAYYRAAVDEPEYALLSKDGDFELRRYAPMIVAEVTHTGERRPALTAGFRRLAAYIFAEDRPGETIAMTSPVMQDQDEEIAMTAPVLQDGGDAARSWRTRFVMPAQYTMETLPTPPEDITLSELPERRIAAVRFSGNGSNEDLAENEARLRNWIGQQALEITGPAEFAYYDAPSVPSPLRRNEVMFPVAAR